MPHSAPQLPVEHLGERLRRLDAEAVEVEVVLVLAGLVPLLGHARHLAPHRDGHEGDVIDCAAIADRFDEVGEAEELARVLAWEVEGHSGREVVVLENGELVAALAAGKNP